MTDTYPVYASTEDFTAPNGFSKDEPGAPPEPIGHTATATEAVAIIRTSLSASQARSTTNITKREVT